MENTKIKSTREEMTDNNGVDTQGTQHKSSQGSMLKTGWLGGIAGGLAGTVFFVLLYQAGVNPIGKIWDFWIQAGVIAGSIYVYWKNKGAPQLHLWEGLIIGFVSTIVYACVYSIAVFIAVKYVDSGLMAGYIAESLEMAVQLKGQTIDKFGEEAYQNMLDGIPQTSLESIGWGELIRRIGISLFMVPIIAMILRK
jgi:hypothetical protein